MVTARRLAVAWRAWTTILALLGLGAVSGCTGPVPGDPDLRDGTAPWEPAEWRQRLRESAEDLDTLVQTLSRIAAGERVPDGTRLQDIRADLARIEDSIPPAPWGLASAEESETRWRYRDVLHELKWGIELMLISQRDRTPELSEHGRHFLRLGLERLPLARARIERPANASPPVPPPAPRAGDSIGGDP